MRRMPKSPCALVFGLALVASMAVGCAKPKPHVRVTHVQPFTGKDPTQGRCEVLGEDDGKGTSEAEARADLRNRARALGADTVLLDEPVAKGPGGRTVLHAQLLRCAGAQAAEEEPEAPATAEPPPPSVEERLAELKRLFDQGLITQEEYDAKRKALLEEL